MNNKIKWMTVAAFCAVVSAQSLNAQVRSQKIGDNPTLINPSAALEVESANKGVLIPRLALTGETDATTINGGNIPSLLIYNTTTAGTLTPGFYYWNGTQWVRIVASSDIAALVAASQTVTNLVDNGDGTITYTNEAGTAQTMNIAAMVTANEVDGIIGNEIANTTSNMGLTRSGAGTTASPYTVGLTPGTVTGQVMTWDGTAWVATAIPAEVDGSVTNEIQALSIAGSTVTLSNGGGSITLPAEVDGDVTNEIQALSIAGSTVSLSNGGGSITLPAEVDGIVGNEVLDATTNRGLVRAGTGTAADPHTLGLAAGTTVGQVYKWDGTNWVPGTDAGITVEVDGDVTNEIQALSIAGSTVSLSNGGGSITLPAEVDGIVGNEVTDAVVDGGLTRMGAGTNADPYKLKINDGTANGDLLTWNGTKWIAQAGSTDWKTTGNAGTVAGTNFIGSTDAIDFVTKTNNTERMRITSTGNMGIGVTAPTSMIHSAGSIALPIVSGTSDITLDNTHSIVRIDASTGDKTITLPAASSANGRIYSVVKSDISANKLIFSSTIQGSGFTFTQVNIPGEYKIQSDGTNWILID